MGGQAGTFLKPRPKARAGARGAQPRAADGPRCEASPCQPACRHAAAAAPKRSCPRDVSPLQLLLCELQQFGETPQETSLSKTAGGCTEVSGAQHVLGSGTETKQRPVPRKGKKRQEKFSSPLPASSATAVPVCHADDLTMRKTWPSALLRLMEALGKRAMQTLSLAQAGRGARARLLVCVGFPCYPTHSCMA